MEAQYNTSSGPTENRGFGESRGARSGRIFSGLLIITAGVLLLARKMDIGIPHWMLSWEMLLILLGFYVGVRHSFRGPVWIVLILIGSLFMLDDIDPSIHIKEYIWPIVIIGIGLAVMFRSRRPRSAEGWKNWEGAVVDSGIQSDNDVIDSVVIFGGVKKNIISKTFKGGEITTIFGGTDLNLTQADVQGKIVLDITQVFGGAKLIVPAHWKIQSDDLVNIFGGLDDKRPVMPEPNTDHNKVLVIKGTCIFGGIDIKSF
ncbi:LiaF transmembrane domain-containing protein [Chryseosolibacter indicus]|uniref:LiaF transmembrane domain-containing protein n=1 Tax=Chryseosolibacter indicus TaxID=2782351 RepID=A0ABS5VMU0_9BACT|nr:DUF5668 domain-containing protein [Chryseosolibacter indicus]MBT1702765.1 hypothetical protein [Chryseosolibacter indicus]